MIEVKVLKTPGCTHCANVVAKLEKLKNEFELKVEEIDITEHPEYAEKYTLMASPGIVINGKLEFVGEVSEEKLRDKFKEIEK